MFCNQCIFCCSFMMELQLQTHAVTHGHLHTYTQTLMVSVAGVWSHTRTKSLWYWRSALATTRFLMAVFTCNIPSPKKLHLEAMWLASRIQVQFLAEQKHSERHSAHITGSVALLYWAAHLGQFQVWAGNTYLKVTGRWCYCISYQVSDQEYQRLLNQTRFVIEIMGLLYWQCERVSVSPHENSFFFFLVSVTEASAGVMRNVKGAVLGSLQTHFVSSISGAGQKEHRNQSWR